MIFDQFLQISHRHWLCLIRALQLGKSRCMEVEVASFRSELPSIRVAVKGMRYRKKNFDEK